MVDSEVTAKAANIDVVWISQRSLHPSRDLGDRTYAVQNILVFDEIIAGSMERALGGTGMLCR